MSKVVLTLETIEPTQYPLDLNFVMLSSNMECFNSHNIVSSKVYIHMHRD